MWKLGNVHIPTFSNVSYSVPDLDTGDKKKDRAT